MVVPILLIGGLNYVVDPLQYFRKAEFYRPLFSGQQRFRNPGIARNYSYDSVVLGTSTADYILTADIAKLLGWEAISLRFHEGTAYEQRKMFQVVARRNKARNIIWALDYSSYKGASARRHDSSLFPEYLYGDVHEATLPYLVNLTIFYWSVENLIRTSRYASLEDLQGRRKLYTFSRDLLETEVERLQTDQRACETPQPSPIYKNPNLEALVAEIQKHPELNFYVFFPPYSVLYYSSLCLDGTFQDFNTFRYAAMKKLTRLENVRLYDFQSVSSITHNLNHYKDPLHYSPGIGRHVVRSIRADRHRVHRRNLGQRLADLAWQTKSFVARTKAQTIGDQVRGPTSRLRNAAIE